MRRFGFPVPVISCVSGCKFVINSWVLPNIHLPEFCEFPFCALPNEVSGWSVANAYLSPACLRLKCGQHPAPPLCLGGGLIGYAP
jgi:hypothetical protein